MRIVSIVISRTSCFHYWSCSIITMENNCEWRSYSFEYKPSNTFKPGDQDDAYHKGHEVVCKGFVHKRIRINKDDSVNWMCKAKGCPGSITISSDERIVRYTRHILSQSHQPFDEIAELRSVSLSVQAMMPAHFLSSTLSWENGPTTMSTLIMKVHSQSLSGTTTRLLVHAQTTTLKDITTA